MPPLQSGDSIGPYAILRRLGGGGMGEVFLGQLSSGETHAVKVMRLASASDAAERERFSREIAAMKKARSSYIARFIAGDTQCARPWFSCEYVQGITLTQAVQISLFDRKQILTLAFALAVALEALAKAGVVHRDIKPDNIIISPKGVKVIDLGIAQDTGVQLPTLTVTGGAIGTPSFMAPERFRGQSSIESDVFAIGAVLAFAMTGRLPFGRFANPADARDAVVSNTPDLSGVPDDIRVQLIEPCLEKDPAKRAGLERIRDFVVAVPHFRSQLNLEWAHPAVRDAVLATVQIDGPKRSLTPTYVDTQRSSLQPAPTLAYTRTATGRTGRASAGGRRTSVRSATASPSRRDQRRRANSAGGVSVVAFLAAVAVVAVLYTGWLKHIDGFGADTIAPSASASSQLHLEVLSDGRTEVNGRGITVTHARPDGYNLLITVAVSLVKPGELKNGYTIASKVCLVVDRGSAYPTEYMAGEFTPNIAQTTWSEGTMVYRNVLSKPALFILGATCDPKDSIGLSFMARNTI